MPFIGRDEYRESLHTADMEVAVVRAAVRNVEVTVALQAAREQLKKQQADNRATTAPATLSPAALQYIRDAVRAHTLSEDEQVRRARPDFDSLDAYESFRAEQFDDSGRALATGRVAVGKVERVWVDEALQAVGLVLPSESPSWDDAAYKATEGLHGALQAIRERMKGEHVPTPDKPSKPLELQPQAAGTEVLLLGSVIDGYFANLTETTFTRKARRCLQLFGAMVGRDTPVTALKQQAITGFLRDICKLPTDWTKQFDRGVTIAAMLAQGADRAMFPTTYKDNYLAPLGRFLNRSHRDFEDDGFPSRTVEGVEYTGTRKADEDKQRALLVPELRTLFEGEQFAAIAREPEHEALYWFSVVLLFTGARPRELCQTNPQVDFGQESGHWFMDLSPSTTAGVGVVKSIKTGEARRVPLHSELVRLGFPAYVERLREQGADKLFPSFRLKAGNAYTANGELFTDLLKATGIYDASAPPGEQLMGAYVLRKTFVTQCRNQGVVSKEITGHSDGTTTAIQDKHYIFGPEPFDKKRGELLKLVMPVTIPERCIYAPNFSA